MTVRRPRRALFQRFALAALLVAAGEAGAQTAPVESGAPAQSGAPPPAPPPPGYYPPPPGYYPPPAYPPPGYYPPPPPGTYAPPPGAYPGVYAPPPPRRARRIFQLIPYIGMHSFQGDGGRILGPGLRVGGLLGFRVADRVTLNGEATIDVLNATDLPLGDAYSEVDATIGLSPLVAFTAGDVELAVGPKLGIWGADYSQDSLARGEGTGSYTGYNVGANGALFAQVGRKLWLGGLATFDLRIYGHSCFRADFGLERCTSRDLPAVDKIVALSALLMFSP